MNLRELVLPYEYFAVLDFGEECLLPSYRNIALGVEEAKLFFIEVASDYCLMNDEVDCESVESELSVELINADSRVVDDDEECILKFKVSGRVECTCPDE